MGAPFSIVAADRHDAILRTAYRRHVCAIRSMKDLHEADLDGCLRLVREHDPADRYVICPSSEYLNHYLLRHRAWFEERRCDIPLVDQALYETVTNKWSFREVCREARFTVPALVEPGPASVPFVAKPRVNVNGLGRSLYPQLVFTAADWDDCRAAMGDLDDYYFEELIDGPSYYLLYFLPKHASEPVFAWSQRNLAQQLHGKSMVCAVSDTLHQWPIGHRMADLLRDLGFHGLAMVEVIQRDTEYVVIEMNPRLWGPSQLLLNAKTDLLRAFAEESLYGRIEEADPCAGRDASYVWLGGVSAGLTWHERTPRFPRLALTSRLGSDVYLRPDTIGVFVNELMGRPA